MENAIVDIVSDPQLARSMLARSAQFALQLARRACEELPIDWLWCGDDVAGQQSMIMGPTIWWEMIKPLIAEIFVVGASHGKWVAYHCCGALRAIIPDLVEIGLNVLNPVQAGCPGMDPLELKHEFGDRLAFMGGLDTQRVLPFGSVTEVCRATEQLIDAMTAGGGGFILAASHTVPPETPDENIFAMYEVAGIKREEILGRAAEIRRRVKEELIAK
ncbi:MAG: uroporphyrinogen decarboxylase family protein [Syntrophobacteraceae bacterium]